jgi:hypothetical protein
MLYPISDFYIQSILSVLHRYPVITADKYPWEQAFYDMQESVANRRREVFYVVE